MSNLDYNKVERVLVDWIKDKIKSAGANGAIFGLSGGIDSSVTALLCQKAFPDNTLGIIMPCYSNELDEHDAKLLADEFKINYIVRDLGSVLDEFLMVTEGNSDKEVNNLSLANVKPRLRMTTLYYYAARNNYLVVGTDNWSELKVGYFTKYGDGGVDITPLGSLVKSEVKDLARHLGVPDKLVDKAPSAGLWEDQTDEQEMGISYDVLDNYILSGKADKAAKERIEELASKSAHKLQSIPIPRRKDLE